MSLSSRALFTIDRNLRSDLSLGTVAGFCGVSRYHLAHAFGETTGMPVMEYVRRRRLSEAANRLADGADNILDLALDYGYASHEAFSRAFKSAFEVTPEAVRKQGSTEGVALTAPIAAAQGNSKMVKPNRIEHAPAMIFVGLRERVAFGQTQTIPAMWGRFMPRYGEIEDKADPIPWGINDNLDDDGNFDYVCAVRVKHAVAPKGLEILKTDARDYAVFHHEEHISQLPETYAAIWNDWTPDGSRKIADAPSLERHMPTFDTNTGFGGVEIWIPLA